MIDKAQIPAAAYIRMSSDRQKDSPDRQRAEIVALAKRCGFEIVHWYEDLGKTGTKSKNRKGFQRLLQDAKTGDFQAVLLAEQSRLSREEVLDAVEHYRKLKAVGVAVWTADKGEINLDDFVGLLTTMIGLHEAREESRRLANRIVSGRRNKLGENHPHPCILGYDRLITEADGTVLKRATYREAFPLPRGGHCKVSLVPAECAADVSAVQWGFEHIANGGTLADVAREWNRREVFTRHGKIWQGQSVRRLLENPTYMGKVVIGRQQTGQFSHLVDEPTVFEDSHEALVSPQLFRAVQEALDNRVRMKSRAVPGKYLLSGLLFAAEYDRPMYGSAREQRYYVVNYGEGHYPEDSEYKLQIRCDWIEREVIKAVWDRLLSPENLEQIQRAINEQAKQDSGPSPEQRRLDELREKIRKGSENLLLADDPQQFRAMSERLQEWQAEFDSLKERIEANALPVKPTAETVRYLEALREIRDHIDDVDQAKLGEVLRSTVERIDFYRRLVRDEKTAVNLSEARVKFWPQFSTTDATITDRDLRSHLKFHQIADYVEAVGRPVRNREIAERFDCSLGNAHVFLRNGMLAGRLERMPGRFGGWQATGGHLSLVHATVGNDINSSRFFPTVGSDILNVTPDFARVFATLQLTKERKSGAMGR